MDIIKFIQSKKKEHTYFKGNDTIKKNIYWLEEDDLETIQKQLRIAVVIQQSEQLHVCDVDKKGNEYRCLICNKKSEPRF